MFFVVYFTLSYVFFVYFEKCVRPNSFMSLFVGNGVFFMFNFNFVEGFATRGANNIMCVFEAFRIRLFCLAQLNMSCKYGSSCCFAVFMFMWVVRILVSPRCIC